MRRICVIELLEKYDYEMDNYTVSGVIPDTDWIEVDEDEYFAIKKSTTTKNSILYGKIILEIIDVKPLIPRLKDELLKILEKEKKEEELRKLKEEERKQKTLDEKKKKEEKKKLKLYEKLKKEFEDEVQE